MSDIVARLRAACETDGKPSGRHMIEGQRALAKVFAQSADEDARNIADVALCMATCIENEARLFDALRNVSIEAADDIVRLTAERDAERKASSAWCDNYNIALSKAGEAARERDALRAQLNDAGEALQDFVSYGCPACGGDCSAANPPVNLCPMQSARAVLDKIKGDGNE